MAVYDSADGIYGIGVYGTAVYGVVSAVKLIDGVSAAGSTRHIHLSGFGVNIHDYPYGVSATASLGTVTLHLDKAVVGVSGTASLGSVTPNLTKAVSGFGLASSLGAIDTAITVYSPSLLATTAVNDNWDIRSINYLPVGGVSAIASVGDVDAGAAEPLSSVQAQGQIGTPYVSQATTKLTPVVATVSLGIVTESHDTKYPIVGVSAVGSAHTVFENPNESLDSVDATAELGTLQVNVSEFTNSVSSQGSAGTATAAGVVTLFDPNNFSRARTVILAEVQAARRAA